MRPITAYISIPVRLAVEAERIEAALRGCGLRVHNPCRTVPGDIPHEELPAFFAHACYRMIDDADAVVLFGEYGRDCAAEAGYCIHARKPLYPYSPAGMTAALERDWMIRPLARPLSTTLDELADRLLGDFILRLRQAGARG